MKPFYIAVPKPCHEDWNQMSPSEKGRFCGACQKTVVDFTHMNDRELVAFFKQPVDTVCGRFYQDQLNREVTLPKKRIPWLKYFLTVTWPAFTLSLKSCKSKDRLTGDVVVNTTAPSSIQEVPTMGLVLTQVQESLETEVNTFTADEPLIGKPIVADSILTPEIVVGKFVQDIDTTFESAPDTAFLESHCKQMDTIVVEGVSHFSRNIVMGGLSFQEVKVTTPIALLSSNTTTNQISFTVFPNPVTVGGNIHFRFSKEEEIPVKIQVLTAAGQMIAIKQFSNTNNMVSTSLTIPYNTASGIYFVQVFYRSGLVEKSSILISR